MKRIDEIPTITLCGRYKKATLCGMYKKEHFTGVYRDYLIALSAKFHKLTSNGREGISGLYILKILTSGGGGYQKE